MIFVQPNRYAIDFVLDVSGNWVVMRIPIQRCNPTENGWFVVGDSAEFILNRV